MPEPLSPFVELGTSGLLRSGGQVREEFLTELSGPRAYRVYREMESNDPIIGAALTAIKLMMRQVTWKVNPASPAPEDAVAADFVTTALEDMDEPLSVVIEEALSMVSFGFAPLEMVWKRRMGPASPEPWHKSKHADGRIAWKRLPLRAQNSLVEWTFDDATGDVSGLVQSAAPDYRRRFLPMEKVLLFRVDSSRGNPESVSMLRHAYRSWYHKKLIENMEGMGIERDFAGIPVAWVPTEVLDANAPAEVQNRRRVFERLVTQLRQNEQAGLVFPLEYHPGTSNKVYDLSLMGTGSRRLFDTNAIIERYSRAIAMTLLADFLLLGHEAVGSFALSSSKTHLFSVALGALLDSIAGVFNRKAIPALLSLNPDLPQERTPKLWHGDVETPDLSALAQFLTALSAAGAPLFPDHALEEHLRSVAGLPPPPEDAAPMPAEPAPEPEPEPALTEPEPPT